MRNIRPDYYAVQKTQRTKTYGLFAVLLLFYVGAVGLLALALFLSFGLFLTGAPSLSGPFLVRFAAGVVALSALIAVLHFREARRSGAAYILKRLQAGPAERADLYHARFANAVEEIAIACGRIRVKACVLPSSAFNSLALIEADGTPVIAATEGLLAEASRDELLAVVAHELAHVVRGDALFVTLACSLAALFERLRDALLPEADRPSPENPEGDSSGVPAVFLYPAAVVSSTVLRLLSSLISREREVLADAAAVEFGRDPAALARAVYKAHVRRSFLGDFSATFEPLFMVSPRPDGDPDRFWSRIVSTHPPVITRVRRLAAMAHRSGADIIRQVHVEAAERAKARRELKSEARSESQSGTSASVAPAAAGRIWHIRTARGEWQGPLGLEDLLALPEFGPQARLREGADGVEAGAREFPAIRAALVRRRRLRPGRAAGDDNCPRCRTPLASTFYEGVPVKTCPSCRGKLVGLESMDRILARREVGFAPDLVAKAAAFRARFEEDPVGVHKISVKLRPVMHCPSCGYPMRPRPYNYQYFVPVDKCLSCRTIWFDADELEILQILVERRGRVQPDASPASVNRP
ncbi:MAG: M48 family metalloprotease [Candidatus Aminicenantes bacterium]|nr:M48 family metalloprotease [Candidatus Aminicenantes bacterium]